MPPHFFMEVEELSRGHQYDNARAALKKRRDQLGGLRHNVFAVVEHQKSSLALDGVEQVVVKWFSWSSWEAEFGCERGDDGVVIVSGCKIHKACARFKSPLDICHDRDGQTGLARATRADERNEPVSFEALAEPIDVVSSPDDSGRIDSMWLHGLSGRHDNDRPRRLRRS